MATNAEIEQQIEGSEYKAGCITDIESDTVAPGLSEDTIRFISAKISLGWVYVQFRSSRLASSTSIHQSSFARRYDNCSSAKDIRQSGGYYYGKEIGQSGGLFLWKRDRSKWGIVPM